MRHAFGRTGRLRLAQTGLLASTLLAAGCGWALDGAPLRVPGLGADGRPQPLAALPGPAFVLAPDAGRTLTLRLQLGPVTSRQLLGPPMANTTFQADDVVHAVVTLYKGGFAAGDAQDTLDLRASRLTDPISFSRLNANTSYWIRVEAYKAAGTSPADLISKPGDGDLIEVATTDDDAARAVNVAVPLIDRPERLVTSWVGYQTATVFTDGLGTVAGFRFPHRGDLAPDGMFYVADTNFGLVRMIDPAGEVLAFASGLNLPEDVAAGSSSLLYVAVTGDHRIATATDQGTGNLAGYGGTSGYREGDGDDQTAGGSPLFNAPAGLAVDASYVYVADTGNHLIRKIDRVTHEVSLVAGTVNLGTPEDGAQDGPALAAAFSSPRDVAVGADGALYVADTGNHKIRKIKNGMVTTLAGGGLQGVDDGKGAAAFFNYPAGVAVDAAGYVWVADGLNHTVRRIAPDGTTRTWAGTVGTNGNADGPAPSATFDNPTGIVAGPDGTLYVTDTNNGRIRRIQ